MKRLFVTILLLAGMSLSAAEPTPEKPVLTREEAGSVLSREFAGQTLYWQPVRLPALVPQSALEHDARLLAKLAELEVIAREARIEMRKLDNGGSRVELNWLYRWPQPQHAGIPYGVRRIDRIRSVGPVVNQGDGWFAEVNLTWYVEDMPLWTEHPDLSTERLLRRSLESASKPFESGVALMYHNQHWQVWTPQQVQ